MSPRLLVLLALSIGAKAGQSVTYCGYLLDYYCYNLNRAGSPAPDGTNLITGPSEHTVHCLVDLEPCRTNGYYLGTNRGTDENPDYHPLFELDDAGNALAISSLQNTNRLKNYTVCATGEHQGDGILRNVTLEECERANCDGHCEGNCDVTPTTSMMDSKSGTSAGETVTYCGYLLDFYCYGLNQAGSPAPDGTNLITGPSEHTVHCLVDLEPCRTNGYYLGTNRGTDENPDYHPLFELDDAGNALAISSLQNTDRLKNYTVCATGEHQGDGILRNITLEECERDNCDGHCEGNCDVTPTTSMMDSNSGTSAGETVTYCGYLLDFYCYGLNQAGSPAPDGTNLITGPSEHTVHCLVDLEPCRTNGYYLGTNRGTDENPDYHPLFALDDAGNALAISSLQNTNRMKNYTVCATGKHEGDGVLRNIALEECMRASCDGFCETNNCDFMLTTSMMDADANGAVGRRIAALSVLSGAAFAGLLRV